MNFLLGIIDLITSISFVIPFVTFCFLLWKHTGLKGLNANYDRRITQQEEEEKIRSYIDHYKQLLKKDIARKEKQEKESDIKQYFNEQRQLSEEDIDKQKREEELKQLRSIGEEF